jgi:hypothetical protein
MYLLNVAFDIILMYPVTSFKSSMLFIERYLVAQVII